MTARDPRRPALLWSGGPGVWRDEPSIGERMLALLAAVPRGGAVDLCTGYISFAGLRDLRIPLTRLVADGTTIRLLIGAEPAEREVAVHLAVAGGGENAAYTAVVDRALAEDERARRREINLISVDQTRTLLALVATLSQIQVRRFTAGPLLHAKGVVTGAGRAPGGSPGPAGSAGPLTDALDLVVGSANLSRGGLRDHLEWMVQPHDAAAAAVAAARYEKWFAAAEPYDLTALLRARLVAWPPELVWLVILAAVLGAGGDRVRLPLHQYQIDGLVKVRQVLARFGGALLADDVGLGKSYMAAELATEALARGERVLIVAPASVRVTTWHHTLTRHRIFGPQVLSYEQVARDPTVLHDADLVVFDEAHRLRNWPRRSSRPGVITDIVTALEHARAAGRATAVLLMTATPVNNDLDDLAALLTLADPALDGRPEAKHLELLRPPQIADPTPGYELLEQRMVRRTVQFIERTYGTDQGFPALNTVKVTYRLTPRLRAVVDVLGHALLCSDGTGADLPDCPHAPGARVGSLQFAAYRGAEYLRQPGAERLAHIRPLLRKLLPKRLESSVAAAQATTDKMLATTDAVARSLDEGDIRTALAAARRGLDDVRADDLDPEADAPPGISALLDDAEHLDIWRRALAADAAVLAHVHAELTAQLADSGDPKITAVRAAVAHIAAQPDGRHIICLATSAVTAAAVNTALAGDAALIDSLRVVHVEKRITGRTLRQLIGPLDPDGPDDTERLCVVGTDRLGEGVNLQRAAHVVHIDLPWNPQLLPQRVGRIRRQRSPWPLVTAHAVLPDPDLDANLLELIDILSRKLREAEASVGQSLPALPGDPAVPRDFVAMLETYLGNDGALPAADTVLQRSDRYRAVLGAAAGRLDLATAMRNFPWGAGAVHPRRAAHPRVLLCLADPRAAEPPAGGALLLTVTLYGPGPDDLNVGTDRWLNLTDFEVPIVDVGPLGTQAGSELPAEALVWLERAFAAARHTYPDCGEVRAWLVQLPAAR